MLEVIAKIEDKAALEALHKIVHDFLSRQSEVENHWDKLPPEQQAKIELAHADSFDESNWVFHEEAIKKFKKWL